MSLWADYIRECELLEIIEEPWGFVTFHLESPIVIIDDFYISQAERKSGRGRDLLLRVEDFALSYGCNTLRAVVNKSSAVHNLSLSAALSCGFTEVRDEVNYKVIEKKLGGHDGR